MPNIATVLKSEIARVARKEVRTEIDTLRKASTAYRSEIAALKKRMQAMEQELRRVVKTLPEPAPKSDADPSNSKTRFSAKGLVTLRQRLALSAHDFGLLVGASGQSVYNWEAGKVRPREKHLPAIAALRNFGKKEAATQLSAKLAAQK